MLRPLPPILLSFRAKVLLPVVSVMALLAVVPLALITRQLSRQFKAEAADNLQASEAVLRNHQALREKNLVSRYRNVPNEPRFKAVVQLADTRTTQALLVELLEELGGDCVFYTAGQADPVFSPHHSLRAPADQIIRKSTPSVQQAMSGGPSTDIISVGDHVFDVVSIPVTVGPVIVGALTFASEFGEGTAQEFARLTRGEFILFSGDHIAAASLRAPNLEADLRETMTPSPAPAKRQKAWGVAINGEHFMYARRQYAPGNLESPLSYLLLSSYEKPLRLLQSTERTFLWIQLLGILAGTAVVWVLVHRVTEPLRQLRDSAAAVGRGDFTQRVPVMSGDECGALAAGFNQMTTNLESSRAELEKTIAALRDTQAQLIQSEKMRAIGTLAGGIAHDFNNILGAILGYTELVLDDVPPASRTERNLRHVMNAGLRAKDLVRQILTFSRQSEPERTQVRLSAIIDETLKLLRASIPSTVRIVQNLNTTSDHVVADSTQLHQVLMNLCTNASHAMREKGGTLTVGLDECEAPKAAIPIEAGVAAAAAEDGPATPPARWVRLTVADTGHGMERAVLERIFEPFFTTKPVGEGTGLGLSVVHGIIKNHGGEISVSSQPGAGTTFQICLQQSEAAETGPQSSGPAVPGQQQRILVVDDEEALANMLHQRLTRLGYNVLACHDSMQALSILRAGPNQFDLVVSDQTMPRLTGTGLAEEISRLEPVVPVILCSGSPNSLPKPDDWCANVRGCILKPVNFADLSRTIHQVLHESKQP